LTGGFRYFNPTEHRSAAYAPDRGANSVLNLRDWPEARIIASAFCCRSDPWARVPDGPLQRGGREAALLNAIDLLDPPADHTFRSLEVTPVTKLALPRKHDA
jgi:hypothetical protein